jgi:hypothetical protein
MIKRYCDCCEKELKEAFEFNVFKYKTHISRSFMDCHCAIIDGKNHPTSGREDSKDLCLICYNAVLGEAWKKFNKLTNTTPNG